LTAAGEASAAIAGEAANDASQELTSNGTATAAARRCDAGATFVDMAILP